MKTLQRGDKSGTKDERQETEKTAARWRFEDYLREMDRTFEDLRRRLENNFSSAVEPWFGSQRRGRELAEIRQPYADLIDAGNEYRVVVEVPGVPKDKLDITVTNRDIRIEGEATKDIEENREGYVRRERAYSAVSRMLSFPEEVVPDNAEASLNNGILEVKVPKKQPTEVKQQKLKVK